MERAAGGRDRVILNLNQPSAWDLGAWFLSLICTQALGLLRRRGWKRSGSVLTFPLGFVLTVPYAWAPKPNQ